MNKHTLFNNVMMPHTITLLRSITMFCGTDNILQNIPHISIWIWGIFCKIPLVPQNIDMDMNDVMKIPLKCKCLIKINIWIKHVYLVILQTNQQQLELLKTYEWVIILVNLRKRQYIHAHMSIAKLATPQVLSTSKYFGPTQNTTFTVRNWEVEYPKGRCWSHWQDTCTLSTTFECHTLKLGSHLD